MTSTGEPGLFLNPDLSPRSTDRSGTDGTPVLGGDTSFLGLADLPVCEAALELQWD